MNELANTNKKFRPSTAGQDAAALRADLAFLNNPEITGAVVPPEAKAEIEQMFKQPTPVDQTQPEPLPSSAPLPALGSNVSIGNRLFFTGKLGIGKDYCAAQAGCQIFGFADPLYELANLFFSAGVTATTNKDLPGMREFLQTVGQWGRGTVNAKYPLTPARAVFVTMIRSMAAALPAGVDWESFGKTEDLWVNSLLKRVGDIPGRVAATNVRFENEFKQLKSASWSHWHVMASPAAWASRLAKKSLTPQSPAVRDTSEQLALYLDAHVTKQISKARTGPKLHCIWNDDVPPPSPRLYTMAEFLALVQNSPTEREKHFIVTGE